MNPKADIIQLMKVRKINIKVRDNPCSTYFRKRIYHKPTTQSSKMLNTANSSWDKK